MYWVQWKCLNCKEITEAQSWFGNKTPGCPHCNCSVYDNVGYIHGYENGEPIYKMEAPSGRYAKFKRGEPV